MADRSPLPRSVRAALGTPASEDFVIWQETGFEGLRAGVRADFQTELKALDDKWAQRITALDDKWNQRITALDDKWNQRIAALDDKLSERIATLDDKLSERLHQVDRRVGEAKADLMRWSFVFWVGAVAAVAVLAGVL
ncbi:MAG TPA: hypothetical protein VEB19_13245 [Gemmatimonadaceae bacterium]|nr:hypothetical protein [Gemmatimonadaceae bacterium]